MQTCTQLHSIGWIWAIQDLWSHVAMVMTSILTVWCEGSWSGAEQTRDDGGLCCSMHRGKRSGSRALSFGHGAGGSCGIYVEAFGSC